jgi:predicted esterase
MKSRKINSALSLLLLSCVVLLLFLFFFPMQKNRLHASNDKSVEKTDTLENFDFKIYIPTGIPRQTLAPLVVGFSPGGNADEVINTWKDVAEKYKWIILASKNFRNGVNPSAVFEKVKQEIDSGVSGLPIDKKKVIASGLSGGGMGSHMFSFHFPNLVSGIVVNTGMIEEYYFSKKEVYPHEKLAVFLASPTDFRYQEMKRDRLFLESLGWKTKWIEFEGGHRMAPASSYVQAARWLIETWAASETKASQSR